MQSAKLRTHSQSCEREPTCAANGGVAELIRREIAVATPLELDAYICGACHDGTAGRAGTTRIGQKSLVWIELMKECIERAGHRAWIYREGRDREFWVVETSARYHERRCDLPSDPACAGAYARGYFDAEGGIPRSLSARFYVQIGQKNYDCLSRLREGMVSLGIACGVLHRPSVAADPDYWRFAVRAAGLPKFAESIGSWHPEKRPILDRRLPRIQVAR